MRGPLFVVVALGALVPIGIALADIAGPAEGRNPAADGDQQRLVTLGARLLENVRGSRSQTAKAIQRAHANGDVLLATCLEEVLAELKRLERKATAEFGALRGAPTAESAHLPYVLLTVVGQKADLVAADATRCRGADWEGGVSDRLAPPTDPNAEPDTDLVAPMDGSGSRPIIERPVDMPPVPMTATPTR